MPRIDAYTEQRIKDAAEIVGVVGEFCTLHRRGVNYEALCPFHNDRHLGSFVVSPSKNVCRCFACGKTWHPLQFLMDKTGMKYPEALRWMAAKYGIYVDDAAAPYTPKPAAPAQPVPELPVMTFDEGMVKARLDSTGNPLLAWMRGLPWTESERYSLDYCLEHLYVVGTGRGKNDGWTIWWYIDDQMKLRTGKMMKYTADGHRDKSLRPDGREAYTRDWVHASLRRAGRWDDTKARVDIPLFGLHLVDIFPDAEICIVESEKTAVMCQALCRYDEKLFMATGSKSSLTRRMLQPLIDRERWIVCYPDVDGIEAWRERAAAIGYERITVTDRVQLLYDAKKDSEKADMADIIVRMLGEAGMDECDKLAARLGLDSVSEELRHFVNVFDLYLL